MTQTPPSLNRFFLRPQFSIYFRRLRRFQWISEASQEYGVFYLLGGKVDYEADETRGELAEQQSLLIEPGRTIRVTGKNVTSILLTFSPALMIDYAARARLVGSGSAPTLKETVIDVDKRLSQLLSDLAQELATEEAGKDIIVSALTEQVAVHLLRRHSKMRRSDELELSRVGLVDRRIRRAVEFMQIHLERDLPLKEIAAASYLSPYHFARLFKKLTGASPHAFLANLRTTRAKSLLAESDLSVSQIAARVGYASPSHFTKAFRIATGLTPREFRSAIVGR
ncbi:MAG TPA: AraC family transcriptional regulator [Pyrinomonadaceae bacterium]|nr:AraC family transcriptional regulator [Pyrinomonadaceae bacterium]